ncbi:MULTISPECIES: TonB family protein [Stenotrophomonas]|uniref:TonB family protein n=1 Tax=Stenotrophomonas TaxID=40323 RepID=UPI0002FB8CCF|nr:MULTISPECIES: TonB family protein [Stenotrophomonas]MBD3826055.1 TonB family protein [Stenotrophomonas sp.]QIO89315.1 peptidase [Stenotrophomonas rhizophila]HBS63715.1 peptidase [Stenotrophomonas sp.]
MTELLNALLQASVWLSVAVLVLAAIRPVLLRLGGAALAYRGWWLLPMLLVVPYLPLPNLPITGSAPVKGVAAALRAPDMSADTPVWPLLLFAAWLAGALAMATASWRAQRRFERALGRLQPRVDGSWQAQGDPGLPALVGLWRPRVVVGPDFEQRFSPAEQDLILRHEHSHRRHGDPWANAALAVLRCVFWFHPLLPWTVRRLLRDQELACDARTVDPHPALRRLYANALLKAQLAHPVAPMACHWRSQPMLKERIAMLKQHKRKALPWLSGQVLVVGLCVGLGGIAWAGQGTGAAPVQVNAKPKEMAAPQYPRSAFEQGVSGEVLLRVEVDAQGRTGDIRVLTSTPAGVFDAASIAAAKQWTFEPALRDGKAVATALKIPMSFKLDDTGPGQ